MVRNKSSNIRVLLAEVYMVPWILPHIGFFEKKRVMEVISYTEEGNKVRDALEKLTV